MILMGSDKDKSLTRTKFKFDINLMGWLEGRISAGEYIDSAELASLLRQHGSRPITESVLEYVCGHLEGSVERPKGRKPQPALERQRLDTIISGVYQNYLNHLLNRTHRYGQPAGWTSLGYTPAELAARLVARRFHYGEQSWRTVQNIASTRS